MFGVTVVGAKVTTVRPASVNRNNVPVPASTTTVETWTSPQLGVVVYSKQSNSDGTEYTTTLKDLSTAEPDPFLFHVPAGYSVVDELTSFTITMVGPSGALESRPSPSFLIAIRPAAGVSSNQRSLPGVRDWASATVPELFAAAYGTKPILVDVSGLTELGKFDASVSPGTADLKSADLLFQQALCAFFHVMVTHERRETAVLVLKAPDKKVPTSPNTGRPTKAWSSTNFSAKYSAG